MTAFLRKFGLAYALAMVVATAPAWNASAQTDNKNATAKKKYVPPSKRKRQTAYIKKTDKTRKYLKLVGITDKDIEYLKGLRVEKIPIQEIASVEFVTPYNQYEIMVLERKRQYSEAAAKILTCLSPALKYIKLPENNLMDPLFEAGYLYLNGASMHSDKKGHDYDIKKARREYANAYGVFKKITEAEWYYGVELAKLNMAYCALQIDKREIADKLFESVEEPAMGDAAHGLYWLMDALMKFKDGKKSEALDSAIKTVVFDTKDVHIFPEALLLTAYCYEDTLDYYRARDVYFEVARLFHDTPEGRIAFASLQFIRERKLTDEPEDVGIEKVFFNSNEDVNETADKYIVKALEEDKIKEERRKRIEAERKRREQEKKKKSR
jgi:hypothetical protein